MEDGNGNDNATNYDFFIGRVGKNKRAAKQQGAESNPDDEVNMNLINLHTRQYKKKKFCTLCTCIFHFCASRRLSRSHEMT